MYSRIKSPITNRFVNINSTLGKRIINNYLNQLGGSLQLGGAHCANGMCNQSTTVNDGRIKESHMWEEYERDEYSSKYRCNNVCTKEYQMYPKKDNGKWPEPTDVNKKCTAKKTLKFPILKEKKVNVKWIAGK